MRISFTSGGTNRRLTIFTTLLVDFRSQQCLSVLKELLSLFPSIF